MSNDFNSLAEITAAAIVLNEKAKTLGLDIDFQIAPKDNKVKIIFWSKNNGDFHLEGHCSGDCTPEDIGRRIQWAEKWLQEYQNTRKERLEVRALQIEAELANILKILEMS